MRQATWETFGSRSRPSRSFDEKIVGAILKGMDAFPKYKILVLPDHPTLFPSGPMSLIRFPIVIYSNEKKGGAESD